MLPHPDRLEPQFFSEARISRQVLAASLPQKSSKFHFPPASFMPLANSFARCGARPTERRKFLGERETSPSICATISRRLDRNGTRKLEALILRKQGLDAQTKMYRTKPISPIKTSIIPILITQISLAGHQSGGAL